MSSYIIGLHNRFSGEYIAVYDASAGWSTDRTRAYRFAHEDTAQQIAAQLRQQYPRVAADIHVILASRFVAAAVMALAVWLLVIAAGVEMGLV